MKIQQILDYIDNGHMALPEFQRGYVWNREQVRGLMSSLYRRHPVGSLLVWATRSESAQYRGDSRLAPGVVKLLLDGQQRITSLYGIIRGEAPPFFDGNEASFTNLRFHVQDELFEFYQPVKMRDDRLWIDVSRLMKEGLEPFIEEFEELEGLEIPLTQAIARLNRLEGIKEIDLHIEEVTGEDKTVEVVVDIFNRVNSGGTKLSQGDLALAKICAEWPEARDRLKASIARWREEGFRFNLEWFLRNVATVGTGRARYPQLTTLSAQQFQDALDRTERMIDFVLNLISGRLGLDHDRVFFGRYAVPLMARYVHLRGGRVDDAAESDLLLFWYLHTAMWGRYSGSTETKLERDLELLHQDDEQPLRRLIHEITLWRGGLRIRPEHFGGWSLGARFYPVLYLLTRVAEARDLGTGLPLKHNMLGKMSRLEIHHIFPKSRLYEAGYQKAEVNALGNFCFLTKDTNLQISNELPAVYLHEVAERVPGALESQWIPMDPELWTLDRYKDFLEARRTLLAEAANHFLEGLLHGDLSILDREIEEEERPADMMPPPEVEDTLGGIPGAIDSEEEAEQLREVQRWLAERELPEGEMEYELLHPETERPLAILDLAWPAGLQEGLSDPVTLLLDEGPDTIAAASRGGLRVFTSVDGFKAHVLRDILGEGMADQRAAVA